MQTYVGTKILDAMPMTRQQYNNMRGWATPADENGADEGYLVEYPDSKPNLFGFAGYVSWSPKAEFERSYAALPENTGDDHWLPHQVRVVAEHTQLVLKLTALQTFIASEKFPALDVNERHDMLTQVRGMEQYAMCLARRMRRFTVNHTGTAPA